MGLFDIFTLAGDYRKAKKAVETGKVDTKKAIKIIESIKKLIDVLYDYKDELQNVIREVKDILNKFKKLKEEKESK